MITLSNRINTLLLLLIVLMAAAIITMLASRAYGGPLDPPAAPSATGTLPQVEPRMPIPPVGWNGTFPIVINQPGSYFLTRNIAGVAGQDGINVGASNVTLDLNGFTMRGFGGAGRGIAVPSIVSNVAIEHGVIDDWPGGGIDFANILGGRLTDLEVSNNGPLASQGSQVTVGWYVQVRDCVINFGSGTALGMVVVGNGSTVEHCTITTNPAQGLKVVGISNRIIGNNVVANDGASIGCADIWITGLNNTVEGNVAGFNSNDSCPFYIDSTATGTSVHRNVAHGTNAFNYQILCGGCDVGPIGSAASSTSPWANISD